MSPYHVWNGTYLFTTTFSGRKSSLEAFHFSQMHATNWAERWQTAFFGPLWIWMRATLGWMENVNEPFLQHFLTIGWGMMGPNNFSWMRKYDLDPRLGWVWPPTGVLGCFHRACLHCSMFLLTSESDQMSGIGIKAQWQDNSIFSNVSAICRCRHFLTRLKLLFSIWCVRVVLVSTFRQLQGHHYSILVE